MSLITIDGITIDAQAQLDELDRVECEESLLAFVRYMWPVIEPATPLVTGWAMDAICEHLEAVTYGDITRLLINVPPGSSKSLLCNVFWPAWEWACDPHLRYLSFSYAALLTERDNRRFRDVILSERYQRLFGSRFVLTKKGEEYVSTDKTGFKVASSIGGVGTGARGDRVILDDPHNVKDNESEVIRNGTVDWFATAMSNRLNDMEKSAIVVIMQRVHEGDVSGYILDKGLPYEHLMIPAEYESDRAARTVIGWEDPRSEEGVSFWPERFPPRVLAEQKKLMGPFGFAGQYQQRPDPAGGGIIKREWWQLWDKPSFPPMSFVVASLDTAYTEKQENDASALTVWGVFTLEERTDRVRGGGTLKTTTSPKVMLMYAWNERLELHDLVSKTAETCRNLKVDLLLVESKASGLSVAQEIRRLHGHEQFGVQLRDPKGADKMARLYSVQPMFADGMVYAPDKAWAEMVITQVGQFPKGKHDDLVDSSSQSLRYLRDTGMLIRKDEYAEEIAAMKRYDGKPPGPLYPS